MLPMTSKFRKTLATALLSGMAASAFAVLGENTQTPMAARQKSANPNESLQAAIPASLDRPYQVHEFQLGSGTTVKEIATAQGMVFAVTWRGPVLPDLASLLGVYFTTFNQAAVQARASVVRTSTVIVNNDGLVMRSSGRMRAFEGYAYAPAMVPAGVAIDDLLQ